ncbi:DNA replication/repair protein RecF [Clostridiaceae bacterium OttesenSCG-928-D20]|nr:DNA replication/repair protein RecF [Clostridiaceae bacterium OttesenSCG-928-D20]
MRVDRIYLSGFRNYDGEVFNFSPDINIISGKNAQGKTNLLEALYILSGGRSFRTRFDKELIGFESSYAEILADIYARDREQTVKIILREGKQKEILQNGIKKTGSALSEAMTAVLFSPDDLSLVKDGAGVRRRLLDSAISQLRPEYARLLSSYKKLLEHKQKILKDYLEKPSLLEVLDDFSLNMAKVSARIIRYRASFTRKLSKSAKLIHKEFSNGSEDLDILYKTVSTVQNPEDSFEKVFKEVLNHQEAHREAELKSTLCLSGCHKDDLIISINEKNARAFASQGQTRTAALSIKLAEREIHLEENSEYPILLLDDVLSELDSKRADFVLNKIQGGQTFITCCQDDDIKKKTGGRVLIVENGRLKS